MNLHQNARLTPHGRAWIVRLARSGRTPKAIATALGVCPRTVRKWINRFEKEGAAGLLDRSSRPHRLYRPTSEAIMARIEALRRQRWSGKQIAQENGVSPATVRRVMTDNGGCYKSFVFRDLCRELGLKHVRTKPYTPKTNGKAERFIQTALREWA